MMSSSTRDFPRRLLSRGTLRLSYKDNGIIDNPKYYYQFTISKFDDKGQTRLLAYDEGDNGLEQGTSWAKTFKDGAPMDAGYYLLVTGSRLASGSVLVNMRTFEIKAGQTTDEELLMRRDTTAVAVLGSSMLRTSIPTMVKLRI